MSKDLASLGVDELVRHGALKNRCSVPLGCVAHGLNVPCELCALEEQRAAVCSVCGQLFAEAPAETTNRPCASIAQFHARGVIAFEDEARLTLANLARHRMDEEAERHRETAISRTPKVEPTIRSGPEPLKVDKEEAERHAKERALAEEARGAKIARIAALVSSIAALAGLKMLTDLPLTISQIKSLEMPGWYVHLYLFIGMGYWYLGAHPLLGNQDAHKTLRWWAPAVWALVSLPWPGIVGLAGLITIQQFTSAGWSWLFWLAVATAIWIFCYYSMAYLATGLTMHEPWPAQIKARFMLKRQWLRVGIILIVLLDIMIFQGASQSWQGYTKPSTVGQHPEPHATPSSKPRETVTPKQTLPLVSQVPSKPNSGNALLTDDPTPTNEPERGSPILDDSSIKVTAEAISAVFSRIRETWKVPPHHNPSHEVVLRAQLRHGHVVNNSITIVDTSGDPDFDRAAVAALYKASPFPAPMGSAVEKFIEIDVTFRANERTSIIELTSNTLSLGFLSAINSWSCDNYSKSCSITEQIQYDNQTYIRTESGNPIGL